MTFKINFIHAQRMVIPYDAGTKQLLKEMTSDSEINDCCNSNYIRLFSAKIGAKAGGGAGG